MFDPTIYENVKVVLEGAVYDLDLNGAALVTQRSDQLDMSSMSRTYKIEFARMLDQASRAELTLYAHLKDLAAEILEQTSASPGCILEVRLRTTVSDPEKECPEIAKALTRIWGSRPHIKQQLSYEFGSEPIVYRDEVLLTFGRKIDEGQIDDFPVLIGHALDSLKWLDGRRG
ncbi:hypothetical protein [Paenibacillus hexagrammi]|uniref:Uncharacterized protein n=1 Tax=Paenibacillus hexagrammi TaxID=2908839 RepID=A0ABY3SPN4_9BACL|nr:hypothetical protein [Paenibacillus sp. YPD9-1]UJF35943.1 hypothetical protein L0M14_13175 [Paenibacillus sp. YPD9-1]